jgi:AraC-like DNA-binding protein
VDPLSDVLRAVRLTGAYFFLVEAGHPWSVTTCAAPELVPRVLPEAEHLICYHILLSGSCWAGLEGERQVLMSPGDVVLFPHGDAHVMSSADGFLVEPRRNTAPARYPEPVLLGPEGARETRFVCGFLGCDARPFNPLLASLPRRIHASGIAAGWLSQFPRQAVLESRLERIGSETTITRLAEVLFIEAIRDHLERLPAQQNGWLAALRDDVVGPTLALLHERPAHGWTLAELARETASSRTVLSVRFSNLIGVPPILYLTRWRMQLAAEQLARTSAKVSAIGAGVGYESEAAFSRAFKRETGVSPAEWRRARRR